MIDIDEYRRVNERFNKRLLFRIGANSGLYSEINNMLLSMAWCWKNEIQFVLDSKYANFGKTNGWTDVFKPFCNEFSIASKQLDNYINPRLCYSFDQPRRAAIQRFKQDNDFQFLTNDVFSKIRQDSYRCRAQTFQEMVDFVPIVYRFNDEVSSIVSGMISELVVPDRFIGFHIRRGDKIVEAEYRDTQEYMMSARSLSNNRYGYVICDDCQVYDELFFENLDWTFSIDCKFFFNNGYNQDELLKFTASERFEKILRLLANIEVVKKAEFIVGTRSSNIGVFLPVYLNDPSRFIGVDCDKWMLF